MIKRDFHVHTCFCDGKKPPEDYVLSAIDKGMEVIGFSGHALTPFDTGWCMTEEATLKYADEVLRLKEKYRGRISILLGTEFDYFSVNVDGAPAFDYRIGSVHYVESAGVLRSVDESPEQLRAIADEGYGGDALALAERYFELAGDVIARTGADIIGHFDLITKFNEVSPLFDLQHPRYVKAWQKAVDRLLPTGKPFEINTGAIARGYRSTPYPSLDIIKYIRENGGHFVLSSDSHSPEQLLFDFEKYEELGSIFPD